MNALMLTLLACEPFGPIESVVLDETEPSFNPETPLLIEPTLVDFGGVSVAEAQEDGGPVFDIRVTNLSNEEVPVYGYSTVQGDAVFAVEAAGYTTLLPGEDVVLPVRFVPQTAEEYTGSFSIVGGHAPVVLHGSGHAPIIDVNSQEPTAVSVGCASSFDVTLTNRGDEPLSVTDVSLLVGMDYTLSDVSLPISLDVGERTEIAVEFDPYFSWDNIDERSDGVLISSTDPRTPLVQHTFDIQPARGSEVSTTLEYHPDSTTDLLILVDNTGVMYSRIALAEQAMPTLVKTLMSANVDLHAAVVTGEGPCTAQVVDGQSSEQDIIAELQRGLLGAAGASSDTLLSLAEDSVEASVDGGCLDGFLRENALLHVVLISGGDDQSDQAVADQVASLQGAASQSADIVISALVSTDPGGCMGMTYGGTYLSAALSTGGVQANACEEDWSSAMEELAQVSAQHANGGMTVVLDPPAVEETIEVLVDGLLYTDWLLSDDTVLHIPEEVAPKVGSPLELRYLMSVECEE